MDGVDVDDVKEWLQAIGTSQQTSVLEPTTGMSLACVEDDPKTPIGNLMISSIYLAAEALKKYQRVCFRKHILYNIFQNTSRVLFNCCSNCSVVLKSVGLPDILKVLGILKREGQKIVRPPRARWFSKYFKKYKTLTPTILC